MGYKGYVEVICVTGHYECRDDNTHDTETDPFRDPCKVCQARIEVFHEMDVTNGYDRQDPSACEAPKIEAGFTDTWHKDHYDNRYALKHLTYRVNSRDWKVVKYKEG